MRMERSTWYLIAILVNIFCVEVGMKPGCEQIPLMVITGFGLLHILISLEGLSGK